MKFDFHRPMISEEKMFENVDKRQIKEDDNRAYSYYKLTSELKIQSKKLLFFNFSITE